MRIFLRMVNNREVSRFLPDMFSILLQNMLVITNEEGFDNQEAYFQWEKYTIDSMEAGKRKTIIIIGEERVVGFFMFSLLEHTLLIEEFELEKDYQGKTPIFRVLPRYLAEIIPKGIKRVVAYTNINNHRAQRIMEKLKMKPRDRAGSNICYEGNYDEIFHCFQLSGKCL